MNLVKVIEENSSLFAKFPAVIDDASRQEITYRQLWRKIDNVAAALDSNGIKAKDRVVIYLPNGAEFIISFFAILKIGAIAVPVNILCKGYEIKRILQSCKAKAIIGKDAELVREIRPLNEELPDLKKIIVVGSKIPSADIKFEDLLQKEGHIDIFELKDNEPAAIYYTSGTTGRSKGAVLSHKGIAVNASINGHYLLGLNDQDKVLGLSPFCHVYFFQTVLGPLFTGAAVVTIPRSSPTLALGAIEKYKITHLSTVPTMFRYLLKKFKESSYDLTSWRIAGSASTRINMELVEEIKRVFSVDFFDTYGSTETSSTVTYTRLRHYKPASVGMPAHGYQLKVIDEKEEGVSSGKVGEIAIKGPGVFNGYWEMPELTAAAFTKDGWYKSGDLAYEDEEGYIYIQGRKSEMIVSGGYKIYPWEVEELLFSHPNIEDAVVVGKKDEDLGEVPVAYVILKPGAFLTAEEIIEYCRKNLAKYKCPREIIFKYNFPRTPSGKVKKQCF